MKKGEEQRDSFSGKLGFILTCIGSAGNIWLFPLEFYL